MTWFKVDDKAHANTKIRKVLAEEPAALALWLVAGSWVADELNDGFVPDAQLPWLMPAGADVLAQKLVAARLWRRVRGGYEFHEWHKDGDGTKRNPTREEVLAERRRKAEAGRKGGLASVKNRSKKQARASASATADAQAPAEDLLQPPSRPSPSKEGRGEERAPAARGAAHAPPEDPLVVAQAEEELRLQAEAAVAAIAEAQQRTARGAAAARANIRRPPKPARVNGMAALNAAVAEMPPLTVPPPAEDEPEPLAEVFQLHPPQEPA